MSFCAAQIRVVCLKVITGVTKYNSGVTVIKFPFSSYPVGVQCTWGGLQHVVPLTSFHCCGVLQTRMH